MEDQSIKYDFTKFLAFASKPIQSVFSPWLGATTLLFKFLEVITGSKSSTYLVIRQKASRGTGGN